MTSSQVILEYEPPPPSPAERVRRVLVAMRREIVRRKPWTAEFLLIAWLMLCTANVAQGLRCHSLQIVYTPPIFVKPMMWAGALLALAVTLAGFTAWRLRGAGWRC